MSSKQYVKSHPVSLGLVLVFLAASAFVAWYSMKNQPPREISFEIPARQDYKTLGTPANRTIPEEEDQTLTELKLTGVKLDAARKRMTGELELSLTPNEYKDWPRRGEFTSEESARADETFGEVSKIKNVLVYFLHSSADPDKWGDFVDTGGKEKPI